MTRDELIAFEADIGREFDAGNIHAPVHLSGGNEDQLIEIFKYIKPEDYVFSTWRSHYHALLKGIPPEEVKRQILAGRSMFISSPAHNFYASAIMGGCLPIACGVAQSGAHVWCFIGDMCRTTGHYYDAVHFASARDLDMTIVVEDNGVATNTPTLRAWGPKPFSVESLFTEYYEYERTYPHYQSLSGHGRGF